MNKGNPRGSGVGTEMNICDLSEECIYRQACQDYRFNYFHRRATQKPSADKVAQDADIKQKLSVFAEVACHCY